MKFDFLTRFKWSERTVISSIFAANLVIGLGIFSLSASVIVSSAFLAVSALAAYAVARHRALPTAPHPSQPDIQIEQLNRRLQSLEGAMQTVDARILASGAAIRNHLRDEMAPIIDAIGAIADIVEEERRKASRSPLKPSTPSTPSHVEPPHAMSYHPLQTLRTETMLREALLAGKLTVETSEIVALPTGRCAYRILAVDIMGFTSGTTERRLRTEGMPSHLIRLFDRVRFAHGFDAASHLARSAESPVLVCPLTLETLDDATAGQEIVDLLALRPGIAKHLCFLVSEDLLFLDAGTAGQTMRNLAKVGCGFALKIDQDIRIDTANLQGRGVILAVIDGELLLAARDGRVPTEIHPADMVQLFDRHGIDLAVSTPASDTVLRGIRALGINLIMRPKGETSRPQTVRMRPERATSAPLSGNDEPFSVSPMPLRSHLRRVSA